MTKYLLVFVGGGIGSMARLFVTSFAGKQMRTAFPWGTVAVNLLGALVIGLLIELMALRWSAPEAQGYLLVTGFLGGFTTFSAFSLETASMCSGRLDDGHGVRPRLGSWHSGAGEPQHPPVSYPALTMPQ